MKKPLNILIANGVNLDLLGKREKDLYGSFSLKELETFINKNTNDLSKYLKKTVNLTFFQSNNEEFFLKKLSSKKWSGIILNPGAWTHTSLALADRLSALGLPFIEVHISNLAKREAVRQKSFSAPYAKGVIYGFGMDSYLIAMYALLKIL